MTREELRNNICPECNKYNCDDRRCEDCDELLNKWLDEYEKQIREDAIEEVKELAKHYLIDAMNLKNATKYGNKNAKQQDISYGTILRYEIADCVDDFVDSLDRLNWID